MKRSLLRFGLVAVLGCSALWLFLWWTAPRINRESYDKIEHGMSKSEVISILNCKPHYHPGEFKETINLVGFGGSERWWGLEEDSCVWKSAECRIYVRFNANEIVNGTMFYPVQSAESLIQRIRRWFLVG